MFSDSSKRRMPPDLIPMVAHTHHALDDAIEQGQLFVNLLEFAIAHRAGRPEDARF
jgi:hypothetical protein